MPLRTPNLLTTLGFCQWYKTSNFTPTRFSVHSFGVKLISQRLKRKVTEKGEGKTVYVLGLLEFVTTTDSEASDVKSFHFEGDAGAKIPPDALGGIGTAPLEDVEVKEVDEEDPDVHFK